MSSNCVTVDQLTEVSNTIKSYVDSKAGTKYLHSVSIYTANSVVAAGSFCLVTDSSTTFTSQSDLQT